MRQEREGGGRVVAWGIVARRGEAVCKKMVGGQSVHMVRLFSLSLSLYIYLHIYIYICIKVTMGIRLRQERARCGRVVAGRVVAWRGEAVQGDCRRSVRV